MIERTGLSCNRRMQDKRCVCRFAMTGETAHAIVEFMSTAAKQQTKPMTSEEFLLWAEQQPGRYELVDGYPVRMQSERGAHARVKLRVVLALGDAIRRAGVPCEAWPDGMAVRIDAARTREPDAVVTCGPRNEDEVLALDGAVIVVEVLSPTNNNTDKLDKLADYRSVPSIRHYLIVHPIARYVIHHRFGGDPVETRVLHDGDLVLDPPGLMVPVAELFPPADA